MNVVMKLDGDVQLQATLARMSRRMRSGVMGKAMREASRPLINRARANLLGRGNIRSGDLYKSIGARIRTYRNSNNTIAVVGPRYPQGAHGHLVERGTKPRWSGGAGFLLKGKSRFLLAPTARRYRGIMPASPFLLPAFYSTWRQSLGIVRRRAWEEIQKSIGVAAVVAA